MKETLKQLLYKCVSAGKKGEVDPSRYPSQVHFCSSTQVLSSDSKKLSFWEQAISVTAMLIRWSVQNISWYKYIKFNRKIHAFLHCWTLSHCISVHLEVIYLEKDWNRPPLKMLEWYSFYCSNPWGRRLSQITFVNILCTDHSVWLDAV